MAMLAVGSTDSATHHESPAVDPSATPVAALGSGAWLHAPTKDICSGFQDQSETDIDSEADTQSTAASSSSERRVRFSDKSDSIHEVVPYAEVYGRHPKTFDFGRGAQMIPAASFVSGYSVMSWGDGESDSEDEDSCEDLYRSFASLAEEKVDRPLMHL
mmetsp:Transcript_22562/g.51646  ORF Transcript_22562/g.51646 Transcript_22562/m.51646 type:complete len:159 (+) Transcript_22562:63-539(+)